CVAPTALGMPEAAATAAASASSWANSCWLASIKKVRAVARSDGARRDIVDLIGVLKL
ncbi:MAG: hypothetical protein ACI8W1_001884, partial [Candidatus Azotimanducaceae bacterium]